MHHVVWDYEVRPDRVPAFVALYADTARSTHFVTLDRWISAAALEAFLATVREAYERLDAEGADLTVRERRLGAFEFEETER